MARCIAFNSRGKSCVTVGHGFLWLTKRHNKEVVVRKLPEHIYLHYDRLGAVCWQPDQTRGSVEFTQVTLAELMHLRRDVTLVACTSCGNGVQNQFSICGLCNDCAEAELTRLRNLLREAQEDVVYQRGLIKLLNIDSDKRETARLWGIEAMLVEAYEMLEAYAPNHPLVDRVADALEARPKY